MFDFEKLDVYQETKAINKKVLAFIFTSIKDDYIKDQWKKATLSMMLNLAEGTGRRANSEKKHFYTISRSAVFECVALMDVLVGMEMLPEEKYKEFYESYEKISKMMLGLFRIVA